MLNAKELLTKKHIGKVVTIQSIKYGTVSAGIYQGLRKSQHDGSSQLFFIDGIIGVTPQEYFSFPVANLFDSILVNSEVI